MFLMKKKLERITFEWKYVIVCNAACLLVTFFEENILPGSSTYRPSSVGTYVPTRSTVHYYILGSIRYVVQNVGLTLTQHD